MNSLNFFNVIEFAAVVISIVCVFLAAIHKANEGQKQTLITTFMVFLVCIGCMGMNISAEKGLMIYANKIEYLGAANFFGIFTILYAGFLGIRIPHWIKVVMYAFGGMITALALTFNYNHLFYRSYHIIIINGMPKMIKEYAPMHTVYVVATGVYMVSYIAMYIYRKIVTRKFKNNYPLVLLVVAIAPITTYIAEKLTGSRIELLPFGLLLADVCLVYLIGNRYYAVNSIALDMVFEASDDAIIIENAYHEYEGSNQLAQRMFPPLWYLNIGDSLDKVTPYNGYAMQELMEQKNDGTPYVFDRHQYRIIKREIRTRNRKMLVGRILTLKDITAEVEHEKFLESYKNKLEQEVEEKTDQLKRAQEQMIFGFAALVENKNMTTGGHIKRTSAYVDAIGQELLRKKKFQTEIQEPYIRRLCRVAPLHDIGKISIPESILDKPGRLTEAEFERMKAHTINGAHIVDMVMENSVDECDYYMAREIALYHHEKWNGTGYPEGRRENDIPLCARIMAIADVFDALISERPYKEAYHLEEAFSIMSQERGTHFDPVILDAFLNIRTEIEQIYEKIGDLE